MTANTDGLIGGLDDAEESIDDLIDAQYAQLDASQAATDVLDNYNSTLNQTMGLASMTVSNLQEFNLVNEKQAQQFRKTQAAIELMLVPLELYLIVQRFQHTAAMADIAAKSGQVGATSAVTASTWGFNAALWANPIVIIVVGAILLAAALVALELKFGLVTKGIEAGTAAFNDLKDMVVGVKDALFGLIFPMSLVEGGIEKLSFIGDIIGGSS